MPDTEQPTPWKYPLSGHRSRSEGRNPVDPPTGDTRRLKRRTAPHMAREEIEMTETTPNPNTTFAQRIAEDFAAEDLAAEDKPKSEAPRIHAEPFTRDQQRLVNHIVKSRVAREQSRLQDLIVKAEHERDQARLEVAFVRGECAVLRQQLSERA